MTSSLKMEDYDQCKNRGAKHFLSKKEHHQKLSEARRIFYSGEYNGGSFRMNIKGRSQSWGEDKNRDWRKKYDRDSHTRQRRSIQIGLKTNPMDAGQEIVPHSFASSKHDKGYNDAFLTRHYGNKPYRIVA